MLPALIDFEPTRRTLHLYSRALAGIPRAHGIAHPRWEHVSLTVTPRGLFSDPVPLPAGGALSLLMDLRKHRIILETSRGGERIFPMSAGLTSSMIGEAIITAAAEFGLTGDVQRERFQDRDEREYDPDRAKTFFAALIEVDRVFRIRRGELGERTSPVQFWTHGFDLSLEWFGSRSVPSEGEDQPAQLNLGFFPGSPDTEPYFYSNPWPFAAEKLISHSLPEGARWHREGWEGSILPYNELAEDPRFEEKLLNYARAVYQTAAPTLI
jgi:hypothetical protein